LADPDHSKKLPRFCDYEGSDYRTAFWQGQRREYEDLAERIALRKLLPATGERIIDIGGGFGRLVDLYAGFKEIVLLDYSRTQLLDARGRLNDARITYVAANLYRLPFAEQAFDIAVMVRVLHHLSDVPSALLAIRAILQPGATFVLEYANKRNLKEILRYLAGRSQRRPFSPEPVEYAPLHFDFHPSYVDQALRSAGLVPTRSLAVSSLRLGLLKRLLPLSWLVRLDQLLQSPSAPLCLAPSMFLSARAHKEAAPSEGLFRCPACGNEQFDDSTAALSCTSCGRKWPIEDGIYDFGSRDRESPKATKG
jgi:SAM-dependent methyltransferase